MTRLPEFRARRWTCRCRSPFPSQRSCPGPSSVSSSWESPCTSWVPNKVPPRSSMAWACMSSSMTHVICWVFPATKASAPDAQNMVGRLVFRGFIVGLLAGLLAFGWARPFGEPAVDTAIAFESAHDEAVAAAAVAAGKPAPPDDPVIFSRAVQSGIGLLTGMVVTGAGLGCGFAVRFAFANGRLGRLGAAPTAALLALFGLLSVY